MTFRIAMKMTKQGPAIRSRSYLRELEEHGFADGDFMNAVITKPRNPKHSRKFWAWLPDAFDNQMEFDCKKRFRAHLIVEAGYFESMEFLSVQLTATFVDFLAQREPHTIFERLASGKLLAKWPRSIAYSEMDQAEFADLYEKIAGILARDYGFDIDAWAKMKKEGAIAA